VKLVQNNLLFYITKNFYTVKELKAVIVETRRKPSQIFSNISISKWMVTLT